MSKSDLTKQALDESFRSLLATKPLDQVTVTAIARNCGVNRQTFYYHFHDVYDLIHWSINTRIAAALPGGHDSEKWQDSLTVILHTLIDDRDLVIKLRHSIDSGLMHRYMRDEVGNLVIEAVTREFGPIEIPERDMVFISRFFAAGVTDAVLSWIDDGMHETPETLVSQFELLIRPDIARLVARLSNALATAHSLLALDRRHTSPVTEPPRAKAVRCVCGRYHGMYLCRRGGRLHV